MGSHPRPNEASWGLLPVTGAFAIVRSDLQPLLVATGIQPALTWLKRPGGVYLWRWAIGGDRTHNLPD